MRYEILDKKTAGLLIVDVQEKLFPHVERACEVLTAMQQMVEGCKVLGVPIFVTEQYPKGLGSTVPMLKCCLGESAAILSKTTFSCLGDLAVREALLHAPVSQWIIVGLEAHVCVLQTARDLIACNKSVTVLNDAITSRSLYNFSTAIAEMRDMGARISCVETVLFELLRDSRAPEFKAISQLVR